MARNAMDKAMSIDAQLRLLASKKLSGDDKLIEYDGRLLDRFFDILQDLHGADIREMVQECYELAAEYESKLDPKKLDEIGNGLSNLDPGGNCHKQVILTHAYPGKLG